MKQLTHDELKTLLCYDHDTGHFYWAVKHGRLRAASKAYQKFATSVWGEYLIESEVSCGR